MEHLICRECCRERDLVVAMIVQRVIGPGSKLSGTRRFGQSTLSQELDLSEVTEADLLSAMDWLLERQERIEKALAHRHLSEDGFVLYDLSSSYVEERCCPLAKLGHSREGRKGTQQVNYGLIFPIGRSRRGDRPALMRAMRRGQLGYRSRWRSRGFAHGPSSADCGRCATPPSFAHPHPAVEQFVVARAPHP